MIDKDFLASEPTKAVLAVIPVFYRLFAGDLAVKRGI